MTTAATIRKKSKNRTSWKLACERAWEGRELRRPLLCCCRGSGRQFFQFATSCYLPVALPCVVRSLTLFSSVLGFKIGIGVRLASHLNCRFLASVSGRAAAAERVFHICCVDSLCGTAAAAQQ